MRIHLSLSHVTDRNLKLHNFPASYREPGFFSQENGQVITETKNESLAVVVRFERWGRNGGESFDISLPMTVDECREFIAGRPENERGRLSWRSA